MKKEIDLSLINNWTASVSTIKEKLGNQMYEEIKNNGPEFVLDAFRFIVEHMLTDKETEELMDNFFEGGERSGRKN
ncbi:MAG: hypothetical protein ACRCXX_13350 [Cetobacterium sp.]|uniref:hypothetical protein n=1 Tax=Cetobacterium sp. TaxID=2071632 RepID=UPI003F3E24C1